MLYKFYELVCGFSYKMRGRKIIIFTNFADETEGTKVGRLGYLLW